MVTRLAAGFSSTQGELGFGPGLDLAALFVPGQTAYVQVWFRDSGGPCGGSSNLTNGLQILMAP